MNADARARAVSISALCLSAALSGPCRALALPVEAEHAVRITRIASESGGRTVAVPAHIRMKSTDALIFRFDADMGMSPTGRYGSDPNGSVMLAATPFEITIPTSQIPQKAFLPIYFFCEPMLDREVELPQGLVLSGPRPDYSGNALHVRRSLNRAHELRMTLYPVSSETTSRTIYISIATAQSGSVSVPVELIQKMGPDGERNPAYTAASFWQSQPLPSPGNCAVPLVSLQVDVDFEFKSPL